MNESKWAELGSILLGLAALVTAAVKGLPPLFRYLSAKGKAETERLRLEGEAVEEKRAAHIARETRMLEALERSAAALARSTAASERVVEALVEQSKSIERAVQAVEQTAAVTKVLIEDQRRFCTIGRTPLDP